MTIKNVNKLFLFLSRAGAQMLRVSFEIFPIEFLLDYFKDQLIKNF